MSKSPDNEIATDIQVKGDFDMTTDQSGWDDYRHYESQPFAPMHDPSPGQTRGDDPFQTEQAQATGYDYDPLLGNAYSAGSSRTGTGEGSSRTATGDSPAEAPAEDMRAWAPAMLLQRFDY